MSSSAYTEADIKNLEARIAELEGRAPKPEGGKHSVGGPNPRALTLDTKDLELLVLDLEKRVGKLEAPAAPKKTS